MYVKIRTCEEASPFAPRGEGKYVFSLGLRRVGGGGRCVVLTNLARSCADCLEIWEPEPPVTLGACPCLDMNTITFTINSQTTFLKCIIWHVVIDYDI